MSSASSESLTARLNKINLEQIEKRISSECLKIADEPITEKENSETEIDGDMNEQAEEPSNEDEEVLTHAKKSVKEMQALLDRNGLMCIPMMTPMQQKSMTQ